MANNDPKNYSLENGDFQADLVEVLKRIALAQESLLTIALEAREERLKLSNELKRNLKAGFQGGPTDGR